MKIFWVISYDRYNPYSDHFEASFETYAEAIQYVNNERDKEYSREYYDIINISEC